MLGSKQQVRVNIVAYNEALFIEECLNSIKLALELASHSDAIVSVIANGCTDNTYGIAKKYCENLENWAVYELKLGDKSNAWNYAITLDDASDKSFTVFVDGDCTIAHQSISALLDTFASSPNAYIIAGVPGTRGNTTETTIKQTLEGSALSGNFYALTPRFLNKVANEQFLLPVGLIGDDSLLAWVSSHDFKLSNGVVNGYLVGSRDAYFFYHRLTPNSFHNIRLYIRRIHRYSLRHLQQSCIREYLNKVDNFGVLPKNINQTYHEKKLKHIRLTNIYVFFDVINYLYNTPPKKAQNI